MTMKRRDFLKILAAVPVAATAGYIVPQKARTQMPPGVLYTALGGNERYWIHDGSVWRAFSPPEFWRWQRLGYPVDLLD